MSEMDGRAIPDDNACGELLQLTIARDDQVFVCVLDRHCHGLHSDGKGTRWGTIDPRAGLDAGR